MWRREPLRDLIDVGANLTHGSFSNDLAEVIGRAAAAGVTRLIVTGTSIAGSTAAIDLAAEHPAVLWATAGVHPHESAAFGTADETTLAGLLMRPEVVAAGECGLDYFRDYAPRLQQVEAFGRQLDLAARAGKPLFLHQRAAHDDFLAMLREQGSRLPGGVAHCFTEGPDAMADYLELGLYIGITGWICDDRRATGLREAVRELPLDRLLIETDAPYLLPRSLEPRPPGRRNEPAHLQEVVRTLAVYMRQPTDEIAAASTRNAERLFGLNPPAA